MKRIATVYNDGNHFIANFPCPQPPRDTPKPRKYSAEQRALFSSLFLEGYRKNLKGKKLLSFIESENVKRCDLADWFTENELKDLYKRKLNSIHKRRVRYEKKINLNTWTWFATFTYDSKKETEEGFVARLRKALSNFSTRHEWRYIGAEERGDETGRLHYHFIVNVPEGEMVGELFVDRKYSTKRKKWEFFLNNTYFQERFGQCCFEQITDDDIRCGRVSNYLQKYLTKADCKLIYSRGVPCELVCEIDTEEDVICSFYQYCMKLILNWKTKQQSDLFEQTEHVKPFTFDEDEYICFEPWNTEQLVRVR